MARKSLSKKTRFEIFKRDNFTCQYCGKQPPDIVLVVDHIEPVVEGGDNDTLNLVTSCEACNQGKGGRKLNSVPARPDADLKWLETQQEIEELRRYQQAKKLRDELTDQIIEGLTEQWWVLVGDSAPSKKTFVGWLTFAEPNQIEEAINIVSTKNHIRSFRDQVSYCSGVLRNMTGTKRE